MTTETKPANPCERCKAKAPHFPHECAYRCPESAYGKHIIVATYQSYGYWHGRCALCKHEWQVDSSG